MPQASDELRRKFEDDETALRVIRPNFSYFGGVIRHRWLDHTMTVEEGEAIDYLCDEWDYAYEPYGPREDE